MKVRFFILSILITVLLSATAYYGFCQNRYLSYGELTLMEPIYGSFYNPPTFSDLSMSGTDTDFPLFAMTHTSVGYTDDGFVWKKIGKSGFKTNTPRPEGFLRNELVWITTKKGLMGEQGQWYYKKYNKIFCVSAYAYVSCNIADRDYVTTYNLHVKVPNGFSNPSERKPESLPEEGYFSMYELLDGDVEGWNIDFWGYTVGNQLEAEAEATGQHLKHASENHSVVSVVPTIQTARDLYIVCELCDDDGCDVCNPYRRHPWQ